MKRKVLRRLLIGDLLIGSVLLVGAVVLAGRSRGIAVAAPQTALSDQTPSVIALQDAPIPPAMAAPANVPPANPAAAEPAEPAPISVTLTADKTAYHRGEKLSFTITAHNNTQTAQTLQFFSGQSFEIIAWPQGANRNESQPAWVWSRGKLFTMDMPTRALAAGASATWTAIWDQAGINGTTVPRGRYQLESNLATNPKFAAAPVPVSLGD